MDKVELKLVDDTRYCTLYSIQFLSEDKSEFELFCDKFKSNADYKEDYERILVIIKNIANSGAFERLFRLEGKRNDRVCALPVLKSHLRLYCLRLSDRILILGNGGIKATRTYNEDDVLKGYVLTLQKFDKLIKGSIEENFIIVTENTIETEKVFEI